jgi:uncharacterized membrane protein
MLVFLPPPIAVDAPNHLARIDQIAHGHVVAPLDHDHRAFARLDSCVGPYVVAMGRLTHLRISVIRRQFQSIDCGRLRSIDISNMALNNPVAYLPQVMGYMAGRRSGGLLAGVWMAKLAGLAAYLVLCWLALRIAPWGKPLLFLVALLPTSMTLAGSLSADSVPLALGLLTTALLLRLRAKLAEDDASGRTRRLLWGLAVCIVLLSLAKNLYFAVALVALLVPADRFATRRGRRIFLAGVFGPVVIGVGLWSALVVNRVKFEFEDWFLTNSVVQKAWIRDHPLGFAYLAVRSVFGTTRVVSHTVPGMVAQFSEVFGPTVAPIGMTLLALGLGLVALATDGVGSRRSGGASTSRVDGDGGDDRYDHITRLVIPVVVLVVVMALVLYGEALALTPNLRIGPNITYIEGRYFLPILPLLLLPLAARGRLLDGATTRAWAWALPVSLVVLTGWTVARFGQLSF